MKKNKEVMTKKSYKRKKEINKVWGPLPIEPFSIRRNRAAVNCSMVVGNISCSLLQGTTNANWVSYAISFTKIMKINHSTYILEPWKDSFFGVSTFIIGEK